MASFLSIERSRKRPLMRDFDQTNGPLPLSREVMPPSLWGPVAGHETRCDWDQSSIQDCAFPSIKRKTITGFRNCEYCG